VIGDFFRAIGIPLRRGRYFNDADNANGELVVIVNREFAEHYWPHQDPIGKRLRIGLLKINTAWMTVVGEVGDTKLGRPDSIGFSRSSTRPWHKREKTRDHRPTRPT
jgi:hypothetical protein